MASSVGFDTGVQREKVQKQGRKNNYEKNVSESKGDVGLRRGVVKASKREAFSGENHVRASCENRLRARSRYYRIRHFSGSSCSNRHNCDHDIPPQVAGALGCNSARDIGTLASDESRIGRFVALCDLVSDCVSKLEVESGQSTVEYALVLSACLGVIVGLGLLMSSIEDGVFVEHAVAAASHKVEVLLGGTADVFSF